MAKTWKEVITGLTFTSAAVVDASTVVFVVNEDETYTGPDKPRPGHRTLFCDINTGAWGGKHHLPGFNFGRCAGGQTPEGQPQALFADAGGNVDSFIFPDGPRNAEPLMPVFAAQRVAFVGEHFYSCGRGRSFLRRNGPGDWTVIQNQQDKDVPGSRPGTFVALDGLSETDIYVGLQSSDVSPHAQIMHWDGEHFTAIPLPDSVTVNARDEVTMFINDLIVAPDGRVFVAGGDGELLVGDRNRFIPLTGPGRPAISIRQLSWFKGALYGGHDIGLFRFDFDERRWIRAPFAGDPHAPLDGPYIDANEDFMVFAGAYTASVFDGEKWTRIAGDVTALDMTRLQLKEQQVEDLRDLRDVMKDLSEGK